jgi:uncharacterized membrane protein YoaK (UPF0700 family)
MVLPDTSTTIVRPVGPSAPAVVDKRVFSLSHDLVGLFLLCFVGGYIDTSMWMGLFGLFTGSVTGNIVVAGVTVTGTVSGVIPRVIVTVVYMASALVGHVIAACCYMYWGFTPRRVFSVLLILEALALGATWVSGVLLNDTLTSIAAPNVAFVGSMAAMSIGLQASAIKEAGLTSYPSTNVLTTTITNFGSTLGSFLLHSAGAFGLLPKTAASPSAPLTKEEWGVKIPVRWRALWVSALPIFAFGAGCCLGAALQNFILFHSVCVPVAIILYLIVDTYLPFLTPPQAV